MARADRCLVRAPCDDRTASSLPVSEPGARCGQGAVGMVGRRWTDHSSFVSSRRDRSGRGGGVLRVRERGSAGGDSLRVRATTAPGARARRRLRVARGRRDERCRGGDGGARCSRRAHRLRDAPCRAGAIRDPPRGVLRGRTPGFRGRRAAHRATGRAITRAGRDLAKRHQSGRGRRGDCRRRALRGPVPVRSLALPAGARVH